MIGIILMIGLSWLHGVGYGYGLGKKYIQDEIDSIGKKIEQ
jgi:uncharacterized protein YneF (UPF0154 family)